MSTGSVVYRTFGGGSPPPLRVFSDTFNRASGELGTQWLSGNTLFTPSATPAQGQQYKIGASVLDGLQCLICGSINGAANPNWVLPGFAIPIPAYMGVINRNQFVQATLVTATGAGVERANAGIGCLMAFNTNTTDFSGYYLEALPQINVLQVGRQIGGTFLFGAPFGTVGGGVVNGDVLRMSADIQAGQVVLTVRKNGTVMATFTDNTASRLTVGVPGVITRGSAGVNPGRTEFRNWSGGVGA